MKLLLLILVSYGISNIIVFGSIFEKLRSVADKYNPTFFGKLLTCMMCTPFWVGFTLSLVFHLSGNVEFSPFSENGVNNIYIAIFLDSCLISGTTWLIHTVQEYLEA